MRYGRKVLFCYPSYKSKQVIMNEEHQIHTTTSLQPLSGSSRASFFLDGFVILHVLTATTFAILMLVAPHFFSYFVVQPADFSDLTTDSIRWVCPFVFGFAGLAGLSLFMPPLARRQIATLFTVVFTLAVCVGVYVQQTGRWNAYHPLNILLFGSLALTYGYFVFFCKTAFTR